MHAFICTYMHNQTGPGCLLQVDNLLDWCNGLGSDSDGDMEMGLDMSFDLDL